MSLAKPAVGWVAPLVCLLALSATASAEDGTPSSERVDVVPDVEASASQPIAFERDVAPIFEKRCVACHGTYRAEGGLRLVSRALAEEGGHTGNPTLQPPELSELLRRVRSDDPHYRMPEGDGPLPPEELRIVARWIEEGAPWPDDARIEEPATGKDAAIGDASEEFALPPRVAMVPDIEATFWQISWALYAGIAIGVAALLIERRRKSRLAKREGEPLATRRGVDRLIAAIRPSHYALAFSLLALGAVSQLYVQLLFEVAQGSAPSSPEKSEVVANENLLQEPYWPAHSPRLGGEWYRGNDERSEELFNGGYYRTATLTLRLLGADGEALERGDAVPDGPLSVEATIERAPGATRDLFRDGALTRYVLAKRVPVAERHTDGAQPFEVVRPGEEWRAVYSIPDSESRPDADLTGDLELRLRDSFPHFAIQYAIAVRSGKIASESTIRMGVQILPTKEKQVPLEQWFSAQPLPVIEGENTDDPELLGIAEHRKPGGALDVPGERSALDISDEPLGESRVAGDRP